MPPSVPASRPPDLLRPFVWLAAAAFLIGFAVSLALGAGSIAGSHSRVRALTPAALPAAQQGPEWNTTKSI